MSDERDTQSVPKTRLIQPIGTDPRTGRPYKAVEVPVRKRGVWSWMLRWAAKPKKQA
jgi:hypothetical protein